MEDDTSVRVAVRIRPQIPREMIDMCRICTSVPSEEPQVWIGNDKAFTFDYVYDMPTRQCHVYESCVQQLIEGCFEGYNATVLAYGQTGSGKTYTMGTGFDVSMVDNEELGIIPRAVDHLFEGIDERRQHAYNNNEPLPDFKIHCQFLELYNEEIVDLFDGTSDSFKGKKSGIRIHEDANGSIYTVGVTTRVVTSKQETLQCLKMGALSRTTASTQMNVQSSRSHAIFTLHVKQQRIAKTEDENMDMELVNTNEFETLTAKFHFVDLAGSERLKRTGATGERAKEGISINCGLLALGNVISALGDVTKRGSHVPYRDSKLTRLLQDSLGGNSRTVMIACISPSDRDFMETLNTLNYANRARNIKNKVVINQDKTSKTISLLKMEIQQLQLELLEYKQGKRVVMNGEESINDMYHENTMLQTEINNLRVRVRALQETIEALTVKNTQLLADKAVGDWISHGGDQEDMNKLLQGYIKEVEDLRNKYVESEHSCEVMRRNISRAQTRLSMSPLHNQAVAFSGGYDIGCDAETGSVNEVLQEAKKDLEKMKDAERRARRQNSRGSQVYHSESDGEGVEEKANDVKDKEESDEVNDDDEDETSESDTEVIDEQYKSDLAQLTCEISIKQKLIEELERSQKRLQTMKHSYEEKLVQLQNKIRATQEERDKVLTNLGNLENYSDEKVKKVKSEYEKKLVDLSSELKKIQSAKKEHARLLKNQTQYEKQMKTLKYELSEMKKAKVRLMNKIKEDSNRHRESEQRRNREIAQLKKESRVKENQIRSLEAEKKIKEVVLRRKQEEVTALRRMAKPMSDRVAGRIPGRPQTLYAQHGTYRKQMSPKVAKSKWQQLEKNITKVVLNKKTVASYEKEMEKWLHDREKLSHKLEKCIKRRDAAILELKDPLTIKYIEDEMESLTANIDYIQENISECQTNIMQMEGGKECQDALDIGSVIVGMNVEETKYMIEKLLNMTVSQSLLAAQRETDIKEMEAKMTQVKQAGELHQELLEHMLKQQDMDLYQCLYMNGGDGSGESGPSSRSVSPVDSTSLTENTLGSSSSTESLKRAKSKARRKTAANPEELLYGGASGEGILSCGQFIDIKEEIIDNTPEEKDDKRKETQMYPKHTATEPGKLSPQSQFKSGYFAASSSSSLSTAMQKSNNSDTSNDPTPPISPNSSRKTSSGREENVFSRLTSSGSTTDTFQRDRGVVEAYDGRPISRALPLVCTHIAKGHTQAVLGVVATDDLLFTASKDRTVKVWDLHRGEEILSLDGHPNNVTVVRYCARTSQIFTGSSAYIKVWDLRGDNTRCIKTLHSSGLTSIGPLTSNTPSRILKIPQGENQINDCIVDHYGTCLFSAAANSVRLWDLRKYSSFGKLCGGHQAAVMCLATDSTERTTNLVATGSKDHFIKLFETNGFTGGILPAKKTLEPPHYDGIQSLAMFGGVLFSGSRDMCIKKWDLKMSHLKQSMNQAHKDWVCGLCIPAGGQMILSCCRGGYVRQWSMDSCNLMGEIKAHNKPIHAIANNAMCIFTASDDNTARIWKLRNSGDNLKDVNHEER